MDVELERDDEQGDEADEGTPVMIGEQAVGGRNDVGSGNKPSGCDDDDDNDSEGWAGGGCVSQSDFCSRQSSAAKPGLPRAAVVASLGSDGMLAA